MACRGKEERQSLAVTRNPALDTSCVERWCMLLRSPGGRHCDKALAGSNPVYEELAYVDFAVLAGPEGSSAL